MGDGTSRFNGFPQIVDRRKFEIDIRQRSCHESSWVPQGPKQPSIEKSYELEEILFRIRRGLHFPLRVRLPLVCNANARYSSGSTDALATRSRS